MRAQIAADDWDAERVNFIREAEPHVMYAKTCGGDGSGAVEEQEVQGPRPFNQTFGEQKLDMGTNEGRLISRFIAKEGKLQRN